MIITPPIRGYDAHGAGHYHAPRGDRLHNGVDVACYAGSVILSLTAGIITKFGRPYYYEHPENHQEKAKNNLSYIEITDDEGLKFRYFYVSHQPDLTTGDEVKVNQEIGVVQDLDYIYPGITQHFHLEIKDQDGEYYDPTDFI